MQSHHF